MTPLRLLGLTLLAGPLSAQLVTDTQIADINTDPAVVGSYSGGFASDGALVYFRGVDQDTGEGYRVWRSDGTPAGTVQLASMALNVEESVFAPGGDLFFSADELGIGVGLWRSDGTAAGTGQVLAPLEWTEAPRDLTVFDGDVWFLAGTAGTGVEVWKSDVATGVTALAFELIPGPGSGASHLFAGAGTLFVSGIGLTSLFATDGTAASATQVASFSSASAGSFDHVGQAGAARVVFNVSGFGPNAGWWSSDGTGAGTFRVATTFNDWWLAEGDTKVYFTAGSASPTPLLWESDGTLAGTLPIDLPSTSGGQEVAPLRPGATVGDELFYGGVVSSAGVELCRTTGAAAGAVPVANIHPGAPGSEPDDFVLFDGDVYFRAEDGATGREIWKLDLTTGAASLVGDLTPGPFAGIVGSSPTILPTANGVIFGQNFATFGIEPGITDGVSSGLLANLGDDGVSDGSNPREFLRFGSEVLFQAFDETTGGELWSSDGTAAGTVLVADIDPVNTGFPGAFGSFPRHFAPFGDRAYFFATHPSFGGELWSTDGTAAGTSLVVDLVPGPASSEPLFASNPVALYDALYFIARQPSGAFALFRTDGTAAGTTLVVTTDPTGFVAEFVTLVRVHDRLLFNANGPEGLELWTSDGTAAGTSVLVDMTPGPGDTVLRDIVVGETVAYVNTTIDGTTRALWKTDGTTAGTELFFTQGPTLLAGPSQLTVMGDQLFFTMAEEATGTELWTSDGTTIGTELLFDVVPGTASGLPRELTVAGDRLFFAAPSTSNFFHYQEVWASDGTAAGTALVADLPSPVAGAGVANFWAPGADRRIVFSNVDANGNEWWVSDGTAAGTGPLADSAAGPKFANPRAGVLVGNQLLFAARDEENGVELHAVALADTGGFAASSLGAGCAGGNGTPSLSFEGGSIALGQSFTVGLAGGLPASAALWFFDFAYGSVPALGACTLQLPLPAFLTATVADGAGTTLLPLQVPSGPALVGVQVDFQALSAEAGGPFLGIGALSDVLEVVVGP